MYKKIGQILILLITTLSLYWVGSFAYSALITNSSQADKVTSGLIAYYTFDGEDVDMSATSAEILDKTGSYNADMILPTIPAGTFGTTTFNAEDAQIIFNGETNGDWFGSSVTSAGDVNGDGYSDILVGASDAEDSGGACTGETWDSCGAAYLFFGPLSATTSVDAENADVVFNGEADGDRFGNSVASAGDVNGDGYSDILVGASDAEDSGGACASGCGLSYLFFGPLSATTSVDAENADVVFNGEADGDRFGNSVASAGDVNGDGYSDILVGASDAEDSGGACTGETWDSCGAAYLFFGPLSATTSVDAENADVVFNGESNYDYFGISIASAGDVNGDGYSDILVGANNAEDVDGTCTLDCGLSYLFFGPLSATTSVDAENADVIFNGETNADNFGNSVASAGDVNGDGYSDILVGALLAEDTGTGRGQTYLFFGPLSATTSVDAENADVVFNGEADDDNFGESVASAGDVNGDGYSDILVGADFAEDTGTSRGQTYLFFGPLSATTSVDAENADVVFNGEADTDYFGYSVASAGDVNGDGYSDILVGADFAEDTGGACTGGASDNCGATYLFSPGAYGSELIYGKLGQGIQFDGVSGYIDAGNIGSGIKTISFWVKASRLEAQAIINMDGTDYIEMDSSGTILATSFPAGTVYIDGSSGVSTIDTDWHNITITDTTGVTGTTFEIGRVSTDYFKGIIDEVRVYNRILSQDEISRLTLMGGSFKTNTTRKAVGYTEQLSNALNAHFTFDGNDFDGTTIVRDVDSFPLGTFGTTTFNAEDAQIIFNGETNYDNFGDFVASAGDVNGDGYSDILVGVKYAEDSGGVCTGGAFDDCGATYLFFGPLSATTSVDAENADVIFNGETNDDYFGTSVASAGDVNGDGYDDILVGAYGAEDGGTCTTDCGLAYLFFGPFSATTSVDAENADVIFNGETNADYFGKSVASAGDVNGDGYDDILVGAYGAEDTGTDRGQTYLFFGPFSATTSVDAENADVIFNGETNYDNFGDFVASAGDVNGDGYSDILVGAKYAEDSGGVCTGGAFDDCGATYLFFGPLSATTSVDAENADVIFNGETNADNFGNSVASAGDVNGDGYSDIIVGALFAEDSGGVCTGGAFDDCGATYLFFGPFSATTSVDAENADIIFNGEANSDLFGTSVASAGDVNGDGYSDILVGAKYAEDTGTNRGQTYLFFGPLSATTSVDAENADVIFNGEADSDFFGYSVASAGDVNGDGYSDILVGANSAEDGSGGSCTAGTGNCGAAYLFIPSAGTTNDATLTGRSPIEGKVGQALEFNGTTDFVAAGDIGWVKSISFWIKADDTTSRKIIDLNGTAQIEINGSSQITATGWSNPTYYKDTGAGGRTIDSDWHHIVITSTTSMDASNFDIGRVSASYFDGSIDDIRIYNRTLSAEDVEHLHLIGASQKINITNKKIRPTHIPETKRMLGHWSFDGSSIVGNFVSVNDVNTELLGTFGTTTYDAENANIIFNGEADQDQFGISVASAGDVNGDGYDDILVGAHAAEDTGTGRGQTYLFFGPLSATTSVDAENADVVFNGEVDTDFFGYSVASAGDVNGDGYSDILVGALLAEDTGTGRGQTYLFFGPLSATTSVDAENADVIFNGEADQDSFGVSVASAGDVNGDGYDDILIGANQAEDTGTNRGQTYLFFGPFSATTSVDAENADVVFNGEADSDKFGVSVASAGDVNGDGYSDILVGAFLAEDTGTDRGQTYLFFGPFSATTSVDAENADVVFNGEADQDSLGISVTSAGDVNGDGYDDILVGANSAADTGTNRGQTYLFFGPLSATTSVDAENADVVFNGEADSDAFGNSVASAGDVNGDGYSDILVGANLAESGTCTTQCGISYLFFGPLSATTSVDAENADVVFNGEADGDRFGSSVASAGDVNGDGYSDILVGAYFAEDAATDTCTNASGNCGLVYHFTMQADTKNATINGATATYGKIGQAVEFDGTTGYISVGDIGQVKSISFWIKADDTTSRKIIDMNGTTQIELNGSSEVVATNFPSPVILLQPATVFIDKQSSSAVIDTDWHHVVITDSIGVDTNALEFGRVSASYFDGALDDIRVYNYVLSADEVEQLYLIGL